jgi:CRISPR-associated endonuclease Csn1
LRRQFGLNHILGPDGEKNRYDHRHHAVDACVIGVTDQKMLMQFAQASASAREQQLTRLAENMADPWPTYREHVSRAVSCIKVSHKPDHAHEGVMHDRTAYGLLGDGNVKTRKRINGQRITEISSLKVIALSDPKGNPRHGFLPTGEPKPYKGYKGNSNYCIEIVRDENGKWQGEILSTFDAYQIARQHGAAKLQHPTQSCSGKPLVMRLIRDDCVRLVHDGVTRTLRLCKMASSGQIAFADLTEANVDARVRNKELPYVLKTAGTLQKSKCRRLGISAIGEVFDPGFRG